MAKKLHDTYNFSYDNLKVLLGGWNTWKENNAQNPSAYPIETTAGATPSGNNGIVKVGPGVVAVTPGASPPAGGTPVPGGGSQVTPKP